MWALFFPRDDCDFDVLEPGAFEKLMELHFAEAEPVIGVKLAGALKPVAEQIENDDAAAFAQDAMGAGDGALGMDRVVQGLAENGEIDRAFRNRRGFRVTQPLFPTGQTALPPQLRAALHHPP